jgi:sec-independent protein translocase protein TatA
MGDLLSPIHVVLLLIVALLVFGPRRLPEIGAGLGRGIREFKRAMNSINTPEEQAQYAVKVEDPDTNRPS